MTVLLLVGFLLIYLASGCWLAWVCAKPLSNSIAPDAAAWPPISILVAARNEAATIRRCLHHLAALDYPAHLVEVLIADDASEDDTRSIVNSITNRHPTWYCLHISKQLGRARGKSNALAHLVHAAQHELLLCVDADVAVPPDWATTLVQAAQTSGAALVVGTTLITGTAPLARAQALDWLRALALLQSATRLGRPFTGMGNNQLIRKTAYLRTGGYEALPFSVTEDFQLFQELTRRGERVTHLLTPGALAWALPVGNWAALLRQRRRWLRGLFGGLTPALAGAVALEAAVYPALLTLALAGAPGLALGAWAGKTFMQWALLAVARRHLLLPRPTPADALLLEGYLVLMAVTLPIAGLLPGPVEWKGRKFR